MVININFFESSYVCMPCTPCFLVLFCQADFLNFLIMAGVKDKIRMSVFSYDGAFMIWLQVNITFINN